MESSIALAAFLLLVVMVGRNHRHAIMRKYRWYRFQKSYPNLLTEDGLNQAARWAGWQLQDPAPGHKQYWRRVLADIRDRRLRADSNGTENGTHASSILVFAKAAQDKNPPIVYAEMDSTGKVSVTYGPLDVQGAVELVKKLLAPPTNEEGGNPPPEPPQ